MNVAAQRFALPACGWAWIMLGSRKNSKRGKCSKMPQNPTRQVHALLGAFMPEDSLAGKKDTLPNKLNQILHGNKFLAMTLTNTRHQNENTGKQKLE